MQRKTPITAKSAIRPLIIKKIETPSIVIETPSSKFKKSLALKRLNYFEDDSLDDEDSIGSFGLNSYAAGLSSLPGESGLDIGRLNRLGGLNRVNAIDSFDTAYRLGNYGSNSLRSSLLNDPSYASANYVINRNLYLKKNKIDSNEQSIDDSQFNESKSRRANLLGTMNSINSDYYPARTPQHDHPPTTSPPPPPPNDNRLSFLNGYKQILIEDRPLNRHEDRIHLDRFTNSGTGKFNSDRFSSDRLNSDRFSGSDRFNSDRYSGSDKLSTFEKPGPEKSSNFDRTTNIDKLTSSDKVNSFDKFNVEEDKASYVKLKFSRDKFNDDVDRYTVVEKLNNEDKFNQVERSNNEDKSISDDKFSNDDRYAGADKLNIGDKYNNEDKYANGGKYSNDNSVDKYVNGDKINNLDSNNASLIYDQQVCVMKYKNVHL